MVLHLLHQANLCFLLNGLVCGTVLTYAECIVAPDELDRQFHQCCHADGGLHIVGEHKECATCCQHTAMQSDTDADACHGEFCYTGLKETTGKIVACYNSCAALDETVCLVGVAEVGTGYYHVGHGLCQKAETCA